MFTAIILSAALQIAPEPPAPSYDAFVESLAQSGQFEGALRVDAGGETVYRRAFGHADAEQTRPNAMETRFHVASITKAFTATLVLGAAERGELSLDDAVTRWIPELDAAYEAVTLRHLLTHTAGVMRDHGEALGDTPNSAAAMVSALNAVGLQSAPGERYNYSNSGYAMLAVILERASGQSYGALLEDRVFAPAGLAQTTLGAPADARLMAVGLDMPDLVSRIPVDTTQFRGGLPGASGIFSTAGDLIRFGRALEAGDLIGADSLALMLAPIVAEGSDGDNAMGWMRVGLGETETAWVATGASDGYLSMLLIDNLEGDFTAAAVQNNTRAGRPGSVALLLGTIHGVMFGDASSASVPDAPLADFVRALETGGVEAGRAFRSGLHLSDPPFANAAASQATGAPDGGVGESSLAWAPATADAGEEWLQLAYDQAVETASIDIVFTQIPDALAAVDFGAGPVLLDALDVSRAETADGAPIVRIALAEPVRLSGLVLHLETAQTPGWPQIDAVALVAPRGEPVWADHARAGTSAYMAGGVSIHDLPHDDVVEKLARRLEENGHLELAAQARAVLD